MIGSVDVGVNVLLESVDTYFEDVSKPFQDASVVDYNIQGRRVLFDFMGRNFE